MARWISHHRTASTNFRLSFSSPTSAPLFCQDRSNLRPLPIVQLESNHRLTHGAHAPSNGKPFPHLPGTGTGTGTLTGGLNSGTDTSTTQSLFSFHLGRRVFHSVA